jgi:hypothetical protein
MRSRKFKPDVCPHCQQTTNYEARLDKGTANIVLSIWYAIRRLQRNRVHLHNDMECMSKTYPDYNAIVQSGRMTSKMINNIFKARYHGLVARAGDKGDGEFLLTPKGAGFVRGKPVALRAIADKLTHTNAGYINPETETVTINKLLRKETPWWDLSVFEYEPVEKENRSKTLF